MTAPFSRTRIATALAGVALALAGGQAFGSAFALAEQNVMGLGNAFAGAAAAAEDANTVWYNPASLARLNFTQKAQRETQSSPSMLLCVLCGCPLRALRETSFLFCMPRF